MTFEDIVAHYEAQAWTKIRGEQRPVFKRSEFTELDQKKNLSSCIVGACLCGHGAARRCVCGRWCRPHESCIDCGRPNWCTR